MKREIERYVITGAPRSGKTTTIRELGKRFKTFEEPVVRVIKQQMDQLKKNGEIDVPLHSLPLKVIFPDLGDFLSQSQRVFMADYHEARLYDISFFDRGLPDLVVLHELLDVPISADLIDIIKDRRYSDDVFVFDLLDKDIFGQHINKRPAMFGSYEECQRIRDRIIEVYQQTGYSITIVPFDSVESRELFVVRKINENLTNGQIGQRGG